MVFGKVILYVLKVGYVRATYLSSGLSWECILTFIPLTEHLKNTFQCPANPQFRNFLLTESVSKVGFLVEINFLLKSEGVALLFLLLLPTVSF